MSGRRWSPNLSGLTLDLDAGHPSIALSGGNVSSIPNRAGGSAWTQGTGANQPAWSATSGAAGYPGITFTGSPKSLGGPLLSTLVSAAAFTMLLIVQPTTLVQNAAPYYSNDQVLGDVAGYMSISLRKTGLSTGPGAVTGGVYAGAQTAQASGLLVGTPQLLTMRLASPTITVQRAGDAPATAAAGDIPVLSGAMRLGGPVNSLYGQFVFTRCLMWNRALTAAELLREQRGLARVYGLVSP